MCQRARRKSFFVEFLAVRTGDEMVFGVTRDATVARVSGFANLRLRNVWTYAKNGGQTPTLCFGTASVQTDSGFVQGDRVGVCITPPRRQVRFYRNGALVGDNLPDHPLPEANIRSEGFAIYALVDLMGDVIEIMQSRFLSDNEEPYGGI